MQQLPMQPPLSITQIQFCTRASQTIAWQAIRYTLNLSFRVLTRIASLAPTNLQGLVFSPETIRAQGETVRRVSR